MPSASSGGRVAFYFHERLADRAGECLGDRGPRVRVIAVRVEKGSLDVSDTAEFPFRARQFGDEEFVGTGFGLVILP